MSGSALTRPGERDRLIVKFSEIDWLLGLALALLAIAGSLVLFSGAGDWSYAGPHFMRFSIFFVMMLVLAMVDLRVWFALAYPLYGVGVLLILLVDLIGDNRMGATRWLSIGGFSFQPTDIMRIALVLALARFYHGLSAESAKLSWRLLIPTAMILVPVGLVAAQPDLGSGIVILLVGASVMLVAGLSWRIILMLGGVGLLVVAPVLTYVLLDPNQQLLHDYQLTRIKVLFDPASDPSGAGYNINQSMIAIGSGGLLGRGFGLGSQSTGDFLPENHTDFIFAALGEAFGFAGCVSVLLLYAAAIFMAYRTAALSHSHFGRLGAAGMTTTFGLYVLINGAMVMGMAPVVGVPMPLLSYGGTVMLTVMIGFGFVQAVKVHRYSEITSGKGTLV